MPKNPTGGGSHVCKHGLEYVRDRNATPVDEIHARNGSQLGDVCIAGDINLNRFQIL